MDTSRPSLRTNWTRPPIGSSRPRKRPRCIPPTPLSGGSAPAPRAANDPRGLPSPPKTGGPRLRRAPRINREGARSYDAVAKREAHIIETYGAPPGPRRARSVNSARSPGLANKPPPHRAQIPRLPCAREPRALRGRGQGAARRAPRAPRRADAGGGTAGAERTNLPVSI